MRGREREIVRGTESERERKEAMRSKTVLTLVAHEVVHIGNDLVAGLVAKRVRPHLDQLTHLSAHRLRLFLQ